MKPTTHFPFFALLLGAITILSLSLVGCADNSPPDSGDADAESPEFDFARISDVSPGIELDVRYVTGNNFIGRPIEGYLAAECMLSTEAAEALAHAHQLAVDLGYAIKVYDCYRPQRAVANFVSWAEALDDTLMQHRFYPAVPKTELFDQGYIAARSGHTRGSTVDLTLVPPGTSQPPAPMDGARFDCRAPAQDRYPDNSIEMGTGYDCFDELSHTANPAVSEEAMANRLMLKSIMEEAGFVNYDKEWWHYTLADEPYPDTYFDVPVE